ncbi:Oidioi.mRNA.OKI2018_I69.chr2.g6222.t3.cds [Oikopleura dioica]|uniref:Oidioi.mRNA.OKI2018_I69.chr2.g6222.t3.cds n=1 Tax=Oikopleura dioica TaxID=34765 RepID=A0ABN7T8T2_OIKDI|nr:Oidioi.mRNA.OKI2018_I69.chr2.g6222.t3.cds [Oikopleura dioica]
MFLCCCRSMIWGERSWAHSLEALWKGEDDPRSTMGWYWGGDYFRCSSYFRPIKASTGTRFMYVSVLFIFTSLSVFLLSDIVKQRFFDASFVCNTFVEGYRRPFSFHCDDLTAPAGIYRIFFNLSFFHLLLLVITVGTKTNRSVSARLHNGFWFWKSALLLVNLYATFKVNISPAMNVLMIIGVAGGCAFLIIQLFCLYDLATNVALSWELAAIERGYHWNLLIWTLSLLFSGISICAYVLMFHIFTKSSDGRTCVYNATIFGVNATLSLVSVLVSFLYLSKTSSSGHDVLQSSLLTLYVTFLVGTSLNSYPNKDKSESCRDFTFVEKILSQQNPSRSSGYISPNESFFGARTVSAEEALVFEIENIVKWFSIFIAVLSGCYSSVINVAKFNEFLTIPSRPMFLDCSNRCVSRPKTPEEIYAPYIDDEKNSFKYTYWHLHFVFICGSFYMMVTLTNWFDPAASERFRTDQMDHIANGSMSIFWVRASTACACQLLSLLTIIVKLYYKNSSLTPRWKWFLHMGFIL